ncbi:TetR/AcrR family transcriptional regulator [Pseudonocardia sp.]|uniref:TetR/AcrR family transcriptional regulator n=1 Tax=Pseudonocardia sp. TaxID=60912 RepID=UPI003D09DC87
MADRRRYSTTLRSEQTALTRRRILDAAGTLFAANGYLGTTVAAVAAAADVSVQTVYNVVGNKAALLKNVYDVTIAGDDEPVSIADRPEGRAIETAATAEESLRAYAALARLLGGRTFALLTMLLAQADSGDEDLRAFVETTERQRRIGNEGTARHVAENFGLRPGTTVEEATDVLWVLTSPEVTDRLIRRLGWSWERYERWLGQAMCDLLLGPGR